MLRLAASQNPIVKNNMRSGKVSVSVTGQSDSLIGIYRAIFHRGSPNGSCATYVGIFTAKFNFGIVSIDGRRCRGSRSGRASVGKVPLYLNRPYSFIAGVIISSSFISAFCRGPSKGKVCPNFYNIITAVFAIFGIGFCFFERPFSGKC